MAPVPTEFLARRSPTPSDSVHRKQAEASPQLQMNSIRWSLYLLVFFCVGRGINVLFIQQNVSPPVQELNHLHSSLQSNPWEGSEAKAYESMPITSDMMDTGESGIPSMSKALECLRRSKPELPDISYPKDALEHYHHIHERLEEWLQHPGHKAHKAAKYKGPWIENRWILRFQKELESKNNSLPDVFGPYIPIFVPWTDHWVRSRYRYPRQLALAMQDLLREDVLYIIVSQNADGFVGSCTEFLDLQTKFHITVLSAGGFGHVPIPLLKQPEKLLEKPPVAERQHLISYVGKASNAPYGMRERMINVTGVHYYYGDGWREIMKQSKFSLCPRGFGRSSYHVMEALQMGLIPIQVYLEDDQPWFPYGEIMKNISYAVTTTELPELIRHLSKLPNATIASMEEKIENMREDYFSFEGTLQQIGKFMLNPTSSGLVCQPITPDSGSGKAKVKSCVNRAPRKTRSEKKRERDEITG